MPSYTVVLTDDDAATLAWALGQYADLPNVPADIGSLVQRVVDDQVTRWRAGHKRVSRERVEDAIDRSTTTVRSKIAPALENLARMSPDRQAAVLDQLANAAVR